MKTFFAVFKPGVWALLWGAVMLMTAGCALPIGPDYVTPLSSGQVPYIAEYNLQLYVPVPVAGKQPVKQVSNRVGMDVRVVWKNDTGEDITEGLGVFENGLVYQALITLTAKNGYEFAADIPFAYEGGMVRGQTSDDNDHPTSRTVHAEYMAATDFSPTPTSQMAGQFDLTGHIPAPAAGQVPVSLFLDPQYVGSVQWKVGNDVHAGLFAADTAYTATVTLDPAAGYTLDGLAANSFTHTDASTISYDAVAGKVTIKFKETAKRAISGPIDLTLYLPAPAWGQQPAAALAVPVGSPFTGGTVAWKKSGSSYTDAFVAGETYTATVTLAPAPGHAFADGVAFTHSKSDGAPAVTAAGDNRTVTIKFVKTPVTLIQNVLLFNYIPNPVVGERKVTHFVSIGYSGDITWQGGGTGDFFEYSGDYHAQIILSPLPGYAFDPVCFFEDLEVVDSSRAGYVQASAGLKKIEVTVQFLPGWLVVDFYFNRLPPSPPSP